jgi:hypothetical protein
MLVRIIIYDRIPTSSVIAILYFSMKNFTFSKIPLSYVNPDKPLPISCNQTYTYPITYQEIKVQ